MPDILVVDDEAMIRESLATLFQRRGLSVDVAVDGSDALKKFAANPSRVVILDIIMPEKEGIETIRELRKDFPDVRIIAISGGGRGGALTFLNVAKTLGADEALSKPFSRSQIVDLVLKYLGT